MTLTIRQDDPRIPEAMALFAAHLDYCRSSSPPESAHALDVESLCAPEVTFWTAWDGARLVACGALKQLVKVK